MADRAIDTVVFDVGHVLFDWDMRHLFRKLGDEATAERVVAEVVTPDWHWGADSGRPLDEMVAEGIAAHPADAAYVTAWATRFNETIPGPIPGSLQIVRDLAARCVPLFAITNFGAEFWAGFRPTQPIFDLFQGIVVSGVERLIKPDPAIYALAIARWGIDPARTIFIDDRADNVSGAEAAGMAGHVFKDAEGLRADLTARGLLG